MVKKEYLYTSRCGTKDGTPGSCTVIGRHLMFTVNHHASETKDRQIKKKALAQVFFPKTPLIHDSTIKNVDIDFSTKIITTLECPSVSFTC